MKSKPQGKKDNPYKVLYWMGGGLLVLALAVVALIVLMPNQSGPFDPERTVIYLYDEVDPTGPAQIMLVEESTSNQSLLAIALPAPKGARELGGAKKARSVQAYLTEQIGRKVHHRVFMPYDVIATLIDAAAGIELNGRPLNGPEAVAYIKEGGTESSRRATEVLLALTRAVYEGGISLGTGEALSLARALETDLDLLAVPDVLGRWAGYGVPPIHASNGEDLAALAGFLRPDPVAEPAK